MSRGQEAYLLRGYGVRVRLPRDQTDAVSESEEEEPRVQVPKKCTPLAGIQSLAQSALHRLSLFLRQPSEDVVSVNLGAQGVGLLSEYRSALQALSDVGFNSATSSVDLRSDHVSSARRRSRCD